MFHRLFLAPFNFAVSNLTKDSPIDPLDKSQSWSRSATRDLELLNFVRYLRYRHVYMPNHNSDTVSVENFDYFSNHIWCNTMFQMIIFNKRQGMIFRGCCRCDLYTYIRGTMFVIFQRSDYLKSRKSLKNIHLKIKKILFCLFHNLKITRLNNYFSITNPK